jgi:membrane protein
VTGNRVKTRFDQSKQSVTRSTAYRAYARYRIQRGSRLAAAITYSAFLSLFPLLALAVAISVAALGDSGITRLRGQIARNVPGIADRLPLDGIVNNAATIGFISGALLLWSGLSWVNMTRGSVRSIWAVDDSPGAFFRRKLADLVSLIGLGLTAAVSFSASAATTAVADRVLRFLDVSDTAVARAILWVVGLAVGIGAGTLMFAYLLTGIPRLLVPRRVLLSTALVAAVVFELTKGLVAIYLNTVASKTIYGAFGVPVALLLWFNITFQVVLLLSAWTATRTEDMLNS